VINTSVLRTIEHRFCYTLSLNDRTKKEKAGPTTTLSFFYTPYPKVADARGLHAWALVFIACLLPLKASCPVQIIMANGLNLLNDDLPQIRSNRTNRLNTHQSAQTWASNVEKTVLDQVLKIRMVMVVSSFLRRSKHFKKKAPARWVGRAMS